MPYPPKARLPIPDACPVGAVWVPLTRGRFALVDEEDAKRVFAHSWSVKDCGRGACTVYAESQIAQRKVPLHRFVLLLGVDGPMVDHRNRDGLDCRRSNLRLCTSRLNQANKPPRPHSSQYKGVSWDKERAKWAVHCKVKAGERQQFIGRFDSEVAAALAYNEAASVAFGEFAHLNEVA